MHIKYETLYIYQLVIEDYIFATFVVRVNYSLEMSSLKIEHKDMLKVWKTYA